MITTEQNEVAVFTPLVGGNMGVVPVRLVLVRIGIQDVANLSTVLLIFRINKRYITTRKGAPIAR